MKVFKGEVGGHQYYFKNINEDSYQVEPYSHKETKRFRMTRRNAAEVDGADKKEWLIADNETVPQHIRSQEGDFSNYLQEQLTAEA